METVESEQPSRTGTHPFATWIVAFCLLLLTLSAANAALPAPFSTFFQDNSSVLSLGHDSAGNLFVLGVLPNGPHFVARLDAGATKVVNIQPLTASGSSMVVDAAGNQYIAGAISAPDPSNPRPSPSAPSKAYPFVLKLDPTGRVLYSFTLETVAAATLSGIVLDADGSVVVTGFSTEAGFPSVGGGYANAATKLSDWIDIPGQPFIARVAPNGSKLVATAVGVGGGHVAIGPGGDIFVSGNTSSTTYPVTPGAFQSTFTPSFDCSFICQMVFPSSEQTVSRLDAGLTKLVYSTFLTGTHGALNQALAVDAAGSAYLTGTTNSTDYPYSGANPSPRAGVFLTKLDPTGSTLVWSVQQGGDLLAFDSAHNLIVGGSVYPSGGLPYQPGNYPEPPPAGDIPAACLPNGLRVQIGTFVQRLSLQDASVLATQYLSATRAQPSALDVLSDGRILVAGYSVFPDIPLTPGVIFTNTITQRSGYGAFLAAFDLATASIGGPLACAADGLTNMPLGPVAPGQWITLFGTGLGPNQPVAADLSGPGPLPLVLGGTTVAFDGVAAPLVYTSSGQINLGVPWEVASKTSTIMQVSVNGQPLATRLFGVTPSNPSLFVDTNQPKSSGNSFFPAVALNSDGSRNSGTNPAQGGSWITLFLNGAGLYPGSTPPRTGSINGPDPLPIDVPVTVLQGVLPVETGPLTTRPGAQSGLYQLQVHLPEYTQSGTHSTYLLVTVNGIPAAPLVYYDKVFQAGGLIWVY